MTTTVPGLEVLQNLLPHWSAGLAGRGLMLRCLKDMLQLPPDTGLMDTARDLALWRWQLLPWDYQTNSLLAATETRSGRSATPEWRRKPHAPGSKLFLAAIGAITDGRADHVAFLWENHGAASGDETWLGETCLFFLQRGEAALARMVIESSILPSNHPILAHLKALTSFCLDPPENAIDNVRRLPDNFRWLRTLLEAQCLLRMGNRAGVDALTNLWREIPWHPNLTLKLHDLVASRPSSSPVGAGTAVMLYSWNNADLLHQTLRSLSQSDLGAASLLILDNGSLDHTNDIVHAAADLFGNRLKTFRLPTNIGAPAARNWLLRHPEATAFDTVVFLDDDVIVRPDWLTSLTGCFLQAWNNVIAGCRILNHSPRKTVQMADVNLLDIEPGGDFLIANAGSGDLDLGLHDYSRPCLSVTGCCHMMDRKRAIELGGFDLRFGPSQFDDFDLDLRNALDGGHAMYIGHNAIEHCQRSSMSQADSEAKIGHIQGNMFKLNSKYSTEQKLKLLRFNRNLLWADLLAKAKDLESA